MNHLKISGFTYVRNAFKYGYPFIESIQSLLPLVDEMIVVVGKSEDGTEEAIIHLNEPKIKIIKTIWDDNLREGGKIFAQQTNIGLDHITGDWGVHLQIDEVFHENDLKKIKDAILSSQNDKDVEGLLFPFYHFWGDFYHIRNTRRSHRYEIRAFKNNQCIRSYKDSQGFRKYKSKENYEMGDSGQKLAVKIVDAPVFHYSYSRNPVLMKRKSNYFHRFWHDDSWVKQNTDNSIFDFNEVDKLDPFVGEHPKYMKKIIQNKDWEFNYNPKLSNMKWKEKILYQIEKSFGIRLFEYKNYKLIK